MRLWSLDPEYLDAKGIVALWREALLAKKVLEGKTKGYRNHPQLERFKNHENPKAAINFYLQGVLAEAKRRGYSFDPRKVNPACKSLAKISVTSGQLQYEFKWLSEKLRTRDTRQLKEIRKIKKIAVHPMFKQIPGKIESWERVQI